MTTERLAFPVLAIFRDTPSPLRTLDSLTTTTSSALRGGFFNGLRVIDSNGVEAVVSSARKLGGVGLFWGFNGFLNRRIRVSLELQSTGQTLTTDQVRQIVLRDFRNWHGWGSREDFDRLKDAVKNAATVSEILRLVSDP